MGEARRPRRPRWRDKSLLHPLAPACLVCRPSADGRLLAAADDEIRTCGARAKNLSIGAITLAKPVENLYIGGQGVPALVCRRAFARFKENMAVRTLFLLGILRDFSERSRSQSRDFFGRQGLPAVSGSPSCPRLQVPVPGSIGLHRRGRPFRAREPRDRFEPRKPGAASAAPGRMSAAPSCPRLYSARSGWQVATGGSRVMNTGRQPERACSGSSG